MKNLTQFIKFGFVGMINTAITFVIYSFLIYFNINYMIANIIGYCAGIVNSFLWNSRWVFNNNTTKLSTLLKFIIVNLLVLGITTFFLFIFVDKYRINKYISQIFIIIIGMLINFGLNKMWTFK